jgi:hypothetical protein
MMPGRPTGQRTLAGYSRDVESLQRLRTTLMLKNDAPAVKAMVSLDTLVRYLLDQMALLRPEVATESEQETGTKL